MQRRYVATQIHVPVLLHGLGATEVADSMMSFSYAFFDEKRCKGLFFDRHSVDVKEMERC